MKKIKISILSLTFLFAFACSGPAESGDEGKSDTREKTESKEKAEETEDIPDEISLEIEGNDQMKYNKDRLTVYEGQTITLTLKHVGEMSKETMGHNWILLEKNVDMADFAAEAASAKENDYIPEGRDDEIIAHTITIGGGEETSIEFEAPDKGIYDFLCSFPGHYGTMKGKFVVRARP